MLILNMIVAFIGFAGWVWIWSRSRYQTGSDCATQIGVMLLGVLWILILVADLVESSTPKGTTLIVRLTLITALVLLKPLLKLVPLLRYKNLLLLLEDKDVIALIKKKEEDLKNGSH